MILRLAFRYSFSPSARHSRSSLRIMMSMALSVAVLVSVISVMEYLQDTRLEAIRNVRSFDAVIAGDAEDELEALFPSASVFLYAEEDALVSGSAVSVRFVGEDYDGGIHVRGETSGLVVPYSLSSSSVSLTMMRRGRSGAMLPSVTEFSPSGSFYSDMGYEFDSCHMFLPLEMYDGSSLLTAVKGIDDKDAGAIRDLGYSVTTWKESERALWSALLLEKVMMYLVLSLLFVVILVSEKSSARRFYRTKRREAAGLELLGMERWKVSVSFILSFLIVVLMGLAAGLVLSFLLLPAAEKAIGMLGIRGAVLSFPVPTYLILSGLIILSSVLIVTAERGRDYPEDILEVLGDE